MEIDEFTLCTGQPLHRPASFLNSENKSTEDASGGVAYVGHLYQSGHVYKNWEYVPRRGGDIDQKDLSPHQSTSPSRAEASHIGPYERIPWAPRITDH